MTEEKYLVSYLEKDSLVPGLNETIQLQDPK